MDTLQASLILNCSKTTLSVLKKINQLLQQKNDQWVFDPHMGINFLILAIILKHEPKIIDGKALARILTTLTQIESQEGGPYYSTLNSSDKKIDLDTNVVIGYFLSLLNVDLDNINQMVDGAIENKEFHSDIFESEFFTVYFISKFYQGSKKQDLIDYLLINTSENYTNNVLILSSLNNLGVDKGILHNKLDNITNSTKDESRSELDHTLYSELRDGLGDNITEKDHQNNIDERKMMNLILCTTERRFANLFGDMKDLAMQKIRKTIEGNFDKQMSLMAFYTKQALGKKGRKISDTMIAAMGLANIFYWTAFIIYDDFWDEDEAADPQILPTANLYARHYISFFAKILPKKTRFVEFFHKLMDKLDAANTWETTHCRTKVKDNKFIIPKKLPDYENYDHKYEPASGHILGPVAMFVHLGYGLDSSEVKNLISYFRNYLIAMQINDDAHDWEEDMKRGHLSTVVVMLIQDFKEKYPDQEEIDLKEDKQKLQQIFWFKTIRRACQTAINYTEKSRQALQTITILEKPAPLEHFITITEDTAQKALDEQKKSADFLQEFKI